VQGLEQLEFRDRLGRRLIRCLSGLAIFAIGISMQMNANLGAPPWDVFHQGVSNQTGITIGRVIVITGFVLLFFWIPLKQKPGLGTILNALEIGLVADIALEIIPEPSNLFVRVAMAGGGIVVVALGTGLYIGSALGPGPRDGLMTGLAKRGIPIRVGRTAIEVAVLVTGFFTRRPSWYSNFCICFGRRPTRAIFSAPSGNEKTDCLIFVVNTCSARP